MTQTTLLKTAFFSLLFFTLIFQAQAQKDTEFWFVAPEISQNNAANFDRPVAFRFSTYGVPAIVTVSQPANPAFPVQTLNIAANTSGALMFPPLFAEVENLPPNTILNKGFLIQSTSPITAYYEVIGTVENNPELFSLKGKNALGTTFYTPFQNITRNSTDYTPLPYASFDIVATEDNTTVTITPTRNIIGHAANVPFNIILNRGQTYAARASSQLADQHPTGSKVVSDKPIAVTIKDDLLEGGLLFGGACRDVMGDQIVPVEKLGTRHVVHKGLLEGDEFAFVLATANATQVTFDGSVAGTINVGEMLNLSITAGAHYIESSAPIYVLQMTGNKCEVAGEIMPALDCSGSSSVRFVRSTDELFYLFLTTRSGVEDGFSLNGNPNLILPSAFQIVPGSNGEFVAAIIPFQTSQVPEGQSSVVSNSQGLFQMGFLNGGSNTGCRFGFFSDFGIQIRTDSSIALCPGETVEIGGNSYSAPASIALTLVAVNGCDSVASFELGLRDEVEVSQTIALCPGEATTIGGQNYTAPATVNLVLPGLGDDCDTLATYELILKNQESLSQTIALCPGETTTIGGQNYTAPGSVNLTLPGSSGNCDTLATYELILKNQESLNQIIALCPGETIALGGQNYTAPATVNLALPGLGDDCDTLATYNLILKPQVSINESIALCPGETVTLSGQNYTAPATVSLTLPGLGDACDTLATYNLTLKPLVTLSEFIALCPGETVSINGQNYFAPALIDLIYVGSGDACDTLAAYHLTLKTQVSINESIALCPGETVSIGGQNYTAPATVNLTLPGSNDDCDTLATYELILLTQPTLSQTIEFCPGETVMLGGVDYTQPTTVTLTLPAAQGCDTIATYSLVPLTPAPSNLSIFCPNNVSVVTSSGTGPFVVNYSSPTAASDCACPGLELSLTAGLPSGSLFPVATTQVCWETADSCGQTSSCCFLVTVSEESPCDIKNVGCMKYELLTITADAGQNRTYKVRVTNNCPNPMSYTAIQIPDGITAISPTTNSVYTDAISGREYLVRNPNFSPMYSVRFKSINDSISGGQSDIFRYKLPAQADPTFINIRSRLEPQVFYEAHLNTFYCPIGITPLGERPSEEREIAPIVSAEIRVYPNPTSGALYADLSAWSGQDLQLRVIDSRGQMVLLRSVLAITESISLGLPESLPNGLYFLEIITPKGGRQVARFVRIGE
ncbi:MAG: T9SS type A sorting domain-containing protein [Saprospiraceae bacterium]